MRSGLGNFHNRVRDRRQRFDTRRKETWQKGMESQQEKMLAEKRKSIATNPSKAAAGARMQRARKKASPRSSQ